jgi:Transcriptional regulator
MLTESDMPPLQMLVVFESSARHLSFTAAARELGTTQPAISQQVKALEGYLKTPLFKRVYRGVELTDAGHILLKTTQASFGEIRKTVTYIRKKIRRHASMSRPILPFPLTGCCPDCPILESVTLILIFVYIPLKAMWISAYQMRI